MAISPENAFRGSPLWLPGGHAQTVYPLLRKGQKPAMHRQRIDTPDGDFIDLDWLSITPSDDAPLVVLFHGLEGSSQSHYAIALMRALADKGWQGAVVHFRGCSGTANHLARAYHSGDSDEIEWILRWLRATRPDQPIFAVGVSLGGNALLKCLGERGDRIQAYVSAAAAVCPPLDLTLSGEALARGFNQHYTRHFLQTLIPKALAKAERFPGRFDKTRIASSRNLKDFDDAYTAPAHGFDGVLDYWRRASAKPWLSAIRSPTLLLNAANDPFVPADALPTPNQLGPGVQFECPPQGGHVGFLQGPWPGNLEWLPQRLIRFFESRLVDKPTAASPSQTDANHFLRCSTLLAHESITHQPAPTQSSPHQPTHAGITHPLTSRSS